MFDTLIICYLFLGGLGSGACVVLSSIALARTLTAPQQISGTLVPFEANRLLFGISYASIFIALVLGAICLMVDLGRIEAIVHLFLSPAPTFITVGAYALTALLLATGSLVAVWLFQLPLPIIALRVLSLLAIVCATIVMVYTGLLLMGTEGIRFWNTALIPILFVLSSLSTGLALLVLVAFITGTLPPYRVFYFFLGKLDMTLIALEAVVLCVFMLLALNDEHTLASAEWLIQGSMSPLFWLGLVGCGLILPFAAEIFVLLRQSETGIVVASAAVLVGGFLLRWCIVAAATHPVISYVASGGMAL